MASLVAGIHDAHRAVVDVGKSAPTEDIDGDASRLSTAGTTVAAIGLSGGDRGQQVVVANVGDSRVYLYLDGQLR